MSVSLASMQVPVAKPFIGEGEERAVVQVLRSGWIVEGPKVARM